MKLKNLKLLFIAIAASATGLALTGCQTTAGESHRKAVACEKCKTVWVPGAGPSKFAGYSTTTRMSCPDCVSAVENYINTGDLKHTCASCGGALKHCTKH